MKTQPFLLITVLTLLGALGARAQGTAFTYQGRLDADGAPYTGNAEFEPTLWTDASGGSQVAANTPATVVADVTDGLFVLRLDFGPAPFAAGADRWLQLTVRTNTGSGPFTTLAPRHELTPTPYAIHAGSIADGSVTTAKIADGAVKAGKIDLNSALHLNNNELFLRQWGDPNHGLGYYGGDKTFAGAAVDGPVLYGWAGGVLGAKGAGERIGLSWNVLGNVGIGTATPAARLHIEGNSNEPALLLNTGGPGADLLISYGGTNEIVSIGSWTEGGIHFYSSAGVWIPHTKDDGSIQLSPRHGSALLKGAMILKAPPNADKSGDLIFWNSTNAELGRVIADTNGLQLRANAARWGDIFIGHQTGNVGIGTTTPGDKLEIFGGGSLLMKADPKPGDLIFQNASGIEYGRVFAGQPGLTLRAKDGRFEDLFIEHETGNVGIGTATPGSKLDVAGTVTASGFAGPAAGLTGLNADQLTSGTVDDARLSANVSLLGQAIESAEITDGTIATADLADNAVTSAKIADGTIAAEDVNPASFNTTFWQVSGNSGTTAGTHFIGTTDNQPLELRANNSRVLRVERVRKGSIPSYTYSANVIGGNSVNSVTAGIYGATIAGGGLSSWIPFGDEPNAVRACLENGFIPLPDV